MCVCIFLNYVRIKGKSKKNIRLSWIETQAQMYITNLVTTFLFLFISKVKKMQFPNSRQCLCLPNYTAILCKQKRVFFLKFPSSSFSLLKKDFLFSSASVRCLSIKKGREQRSCQRAKNCLTFLRDFACVTSNSH